MLAYANDKQGHFETDFFATAVMILSDAEEKRQMTIILVTAWLTSCFFC